MFGSNPVLGILIGAAVTAIMQSSSASVGILQMLAASGGVVTAASAVYISLGSNIGSCCTAMLSSLGAPRNAKRAAVIHLSFNVIGAVDVYKRQIISLTIDFILFNCREKGDL